jgi:hypothetical protein
MLATLTNGKQTLAVNPAKVRYVRASWSSSKEWPRSVVVLGVEWPAFILPLWFLFPDSTLTVDGTVEQVTEALNAAETEQRSY